MAKVEIDPDIQALVEANFGPEPTPIQRAGEFAGRALNPVAQLFDQLDTGLNVTVNALRPLVEQINPNLKDVYDAAPLKNGVPNLTFSDLLEAGIPKGNKAQNALRATAGFVLDIAGDPLTYLTGIGTITKAGKITKAVESAAQAKKAIAPGSKIGQAALELVGSTGAAGIKKAKKTLVFGESLREQAEKGQRALVSIGIPFTGIDHPLVYGSKVLGTAEDISKNIKKNKIGEAFFKVFSTSSGNPKFDRHRADMIALGRHITGEAKLDATKFGVKFEAVRKNTGESAENLKKMLVDLVENPQHGNISATSVLERNAPELTEKLYKNKQDFETVFKKMKGIESLSTDEKARLFRNMWRDLTDIQSFGNPYTLGFRQLPESFRSAFAHTIARQSGIHLLKAAGKEFKYANFGDVLKAYTRGTKYNGKMLSSEDSALLALVGKGEYKRLTNLEARAAKAIEINKQTGKVMPAGVQKILRSANEAGAMRTTLRQMLAHIDESFALQYTMYRTNPDVLKKLNSKVYGLISKMEKSSDWKIDGLIKQFHYPKEIAKKFPELYTLAQEMRRWMQVLLKEEQLAGVPTHEWIGDINYAPHVPVKAVREIFEKELGFRGAGRQWTVEHVNQLKRSLANVNHSRVEEAANLGLITPAERKALLGPNGLKYLEEKISSQAKKDQKWSVEFGTRFYKYLTVSQTEALAKTGQLKILNGRKVDKFFDDNPIELMRVRGQRAGRAISSAQFFEGAKQFGKAVPATSPLAPEGLSFVRGGPLAEATRDGLRLAFEPELARHIDAYHEALQFPVAAHPFVETFDRLQDFWKAWTLSIFPAYHLRNIVGNVWNNHLAGLRDIKYYKWANDVQHIAGGTAEQSLKFGRIGKKLVDKGLITRNSKFVLETKAGTKYTAKEIDALARRYDLIHAGQYEGDIEKYFEQEAKSLLSKSVRYPINAGLKVGGYIENQAKLAHFIWQLDNGLSPLDASLSVKKYLFDYRDLTATERTVLRRGLPFYTWTRKNVPLQIEALLTSPNRPMGVNKFIGSFVETNYDGVPDERYLPDWMIQNYPVRIRKNPTTENFEYFLLGSWLPIADVDKIFHPIRFAMNMLTPVLKEPLQQVFNRDFYFNRDIDQGDEYEKFAGVNMPRRVAHLLKNVRIVTEADRYFTDRENVDNITRNVRALLGKVYPYDPELQREFMKSDFKKKESHLKSMLKKAIRKGNGVEEDRIRKRIEQLVEEAANKV